MTTQEFSYKLAIEYFEDRGFTVNSSDRQIKNGTIQVFDPLTERRYAITKAGYIRTYDFRENRRTYMTYTGTYTLNPKTPKHLYGKVIKTSRLVYPGQYLLMAKSLEKSTKRIRKAQLKKGLI